MKAERWQQINDLFQSATQRPPEERAAFLDEACDGEKDLYREVESLITAYERAANFIESPAFEVSPELLLDDADAFIGQHLGHYRIESVLGVGGMGVVYLAHDERLGRKVGLKLLPRSLVADETQLERLKREARTASALNHPNIVTIHEIAEVDGTYYIATEFIEGVTLRERMAQGPIPPNEAMEIAGQIASALSVAHAAGIVHRDIKPENIMLRPDGYVKVLDFGIAKFTQPETGAAAAQVTTQHGLIVGTTRYMSPEQARGLPVDERTDIWSLGVVLYEMVAGQPPFQGATPTDLIIAIAEREPVPLARGAPEMPIQLERIVKKALAKDREQRHQAVTDLLSDLKSLSYQLDRPMIHSGRRKRILILTAVIAVLITAGVVSSRFLRRSSPVTQTETKSVAVMPLKNLSGDAAQEYFADGLSEELINRLGQIHGLRVIGRNSSFHFKGKSNDSRAVGQVLGVAHLLEGSVRKAGDHLRISVQLVRASDGSQLWSQSYDREMKDIFAVQEEIARAVADQLRVTLLAIDVPIGVEPSNKNLDAYNAYLKGEFYLAHFNLENETKAVDSFDEAIHFDPAFAEAYAAKAFALARMGYYSGVKGANLFEQARATAKAALTLQPSLPRAHVVLAYLYMSVDWNLPAAETELKDLDVSAPLVAHALAVLRSFQNRLDESIRLDQKALALDPLYSVYHTNLGVWLYQSGRYDEAEKHWRTALELQPESNGNHGLLATVAALRGQPEAALREAEQEPKGVVRDAAVALALAAGKDRTAADAALKSLVNAHADSPYRIALVYAFRHERDPTFEWLERAYALRDQRLPSMNVEVMLKPYRSDSRFIALCEKVGLPLVAAQPETEIKSLAVLPLENLSGDASQEYFADGLTDALIGDLANIAALRVISRTSSMHYKGTKKSLPQIARELQVDAVIEGTVQRADGRVRIRAQLIEARSDRHLWAQTYERDVQDVLKLQSDIAQAIAREVRAKTTPAELTRLTSRPPVRPKAFDDYLQGRYLYWNKRTVVNLRKAIEYFESAIREDPTYALPYVGMADCYNSMGSVHIGALPPPEGQRRAEEAALKALELDPTLAEAHTALGVVRHYSWDWAAAEEEFKRAIKLNPNYANAHNFYASYLMSRGRTDEVFAASNRARELDPLSLAISAQRGFLLFLARRYNESIEQLRGIIATDSNHYQAHWFLAHTYAANGELDDAIASAEKAAALSARSPGALGILGMTYGLAGKKDEATKVVNELLELNERRYVTPAALVFAYTGLGDKDQAFVWMEKCYEERSNLMVYLKAVPLLDPLRSDPRFADVLRRVEPPP